MSHYIDKIKLVFIHIPKTGGTFIETKLKTLAGYYDEKRSFSSHYTINEYSRYFNKYIFFCVVRNPFDRLMSTYNELIKINWGGVYKNTFNALDRPSNFTLFITNLHKLYIKNKLPWQTNDVTKIDKICSSSKHFAVHLIPQYYYIINKSKNIYIAKSNILKYENLQYEIDNFVNNNYSNDSFVKNFLTENITNNISIKKTYDIPKKYPHIVDMIYEIYELDFINFNYKI